MAAASSGSHLSPLERSFSVAMLALSSAAGVARMGCRTLVVEQLLAGLGRILGVGRLDDGVDGT